MDCQRFLEECFEQIYRLVGLSTDLLVDRSNDRSFDKPTDSSVEYVMEVIDQEPMYDFVTIEMSDMLHSTD